MTNDDGERLPKLPPLCVLPLLPTLPKLPRLPPLPRLPQLPKLAPLPPLRPIAPLHERMKLWGEPLLTSSTMSALVPELAIDVGDGPYRSHPRAGG